MSLPGGDCVAVQRIPSSDLAMFVNSAVDFMLLSPGDLRNIRDETFPVSRDESGDNANLSNRLSIQPPTDEENPGAMEPPDDLRTLSIEYDAHGDRHKAWLDFTREATFEICKDWPFDDGRSAPLYMVKHFEKHGGDGSSLRRANECHGLHRSESFRYPWSGGRCAHGFVTRDARRTSMP